MIRRSFAPIVRAAMTNSRSLRPSVSPRTRRANVAHRANTSTITTLLKLGSQIARRNTAIRMAGIANCRSTSAMMKRLVQPPNQPARMPRIDPIMVASGITMAIASSEIRAP